MDTAERIFLELAEIATEPDRQKHLDLACEGNPALRRRVEDLLARESSFDHELRNALGGEAVRVQRPRIGPYRVERKLGHGGMGAVYLAVRDDDEYRKQVAVKVSRATVALDAVAMQRFRRERQILAGLEHPNIARLLEGGTTVDGEPYIVMEYVDGYPLLEHCAALETRAVLEVFLKIASAVDHAHRHMILHRDLKPSNILVDRGGEPKLLDFGIAKALEPEGGAAWTQTPMLTPDYSSPEQLHGKPETVASDVYSLGLVLLDMLAGETAKRGEAGGRPVFPLALAADARSILAKALQPAAADRYATVRDFAGDVLNFLEARPVLARPASRWYTARMFVGRHRTALSVVMLLLISVAGGMWSTIRESRRTQHRLAQVRQMSNAMLFDLHDRIRPLPGSTEARAYLVETAQRYLASLEEDSARDPGVMGEIAAGYERLGDLQGGPETANVGRLDAAVSSYRKALDLRTRLVGRDRTATTLRQLSVAQTKMAKAMVQRGASGEALQLLAQSTANAEEALGLKAGDQESGLALIEAEQRLCDYLMAKGRAGEAIPRAGRAVRIAKELHLGPAVLWDAVRRLGEASHQGGHLRGARMHFAEAARLAGVGARGREKMLLDFALGNVLGNPLYLNLGQAEEAVRHYQQGLDWAEQQAAGDPKNASARTDLAAALTKLASVVQLAEPARAVSLFERALAIRGEQLRQSPENVELIRANAFYLATSAEALLRAGRAGEAESRARRALLLDEEMVRRDPLRVECCSDIPLYADVLGDAQWMLGKKQEALESYSLAHRVAESYGTKPACGVFCVKDWATSLEKLAEWHFRTGNRATAGDFARQSANVWRRWSSTNGSNEYIERKLKDLARLGAGGGVNNN